MFFLIVYSNSMSRVWDPRQIGCEKSNWFKVFSIPIVDKCNALTCPLIAYSLIFIEYYVVKHDILVANFQQTSMLHLLCITALVGMVQVWEVKVSRRLYKVKVVYSACYTLYGVIEIVESAASHKLHHGLGNALVFVILLNKCVVARQVITELNLIRRKSFFCESERSWL